MYSVVYLPGALRQLEDIIDYIAFELKAPDAAAAFIDAVDAVASSLRENPYRHPVYHSTLAIPEEIRFVPVKRYNLYYRVYEETRTVEVWRILHQLQQQERHFHE